MDPTLVPHPKILTVSRDQSLLDSRNAVLRSAGYKVVTTRDDAEAVRLAQADHLDAAVLGDSISLEERNTLVRSIRAANSSLPILVLRLGWESLPPEADSYMDSLDGAKVLLNRLHELLDHGRHREA